MHKRTLLSLAVVAFLSGCSMIPTYERPAAPVASQWPTEAATAATATKGNTPAEVPWQSFFADPDLQKLIGTALESNRDLRIAVLNIAQARAQFQIQRADLLPTVNLSASGSRARSGNGETSTSYNVGLVSSSWEIDFFGRISSLKEAALAQYLATEEGRKATQISLIASVANGYLALLADRELIALTEQTLASRVESQKLTQLRYDNGVISELPLSQAKSLTESSRATLAQLRRQVAQDRNALTLLVGQPLDNLQTGPNPKGLSESTVVAALPAGLPSEVLYNRPDIRQAEQVLMANNANIGAARAAFFPNVSITLGAGTTSNSFGNLFSSGTWGLSVAPQIALPIFDAGRNRANLESTQAARAIAQAQYEKAIQTAFREVADALAGQATLGEQLSALQAQVKAETTNYKLSDLRYKNGVASHLDLLDAQRSLFAAQQSVVQTRLAQLQNQVMLYKTLGGGWTEPAQTTAAAQ